MCDVNFHYFNFRIEMDVHLENVDFIEKEVYAFGDITDLDLEIKIEKLDEERNIKTEVFDEKNNISSQIIGEKRKNEEISNLENKKIKQELEEKDDTEEPQEIRILGINESNNQVINKMIINKNECFLIDHFCIPCIAKKMIS